ncbi:MAG: O-methyltransferase [Flavobacteriales bacterium]
MNTWFRIQSFLAFRRKAFYLHGIHSPFVYRLAEFTLKHDGVFYAFEPIEQERNKLLQTHELLHVTDFGAGSVKLKSNQRKVSEIAATSLKSEKLAQFIFRVVNHLQPQQSLELGTSLGVTSAYIAAACSGAKLTTLEGCPQVAACAKQVFENLQLQNIYQVVGDFDETLGLVLSEMPCIDFAFIDGNHREEPTLRYFRNIAQKCHSGSVVVVDDIYWSPGMNRAWNQIKQVPGVTVTIDLFHFGLVFFRTEQAKEVFYLCVD